MSVTVLIAEDEFFVGLMLEEHLQSEGYTVLGPYAEVGLLSDAIMSENFDIAVLDINLRGELVYPVLAKLVAKGRPFILLSGYGIGSLPPEWRGVAALAKPCPLSRVSEMIHEKLSSANSANS